jgi:predicted secreted protein with PEFG-CTERM motif
MSENEKNPRTYNLIDIKMKYITSIFIGFIAVLVFAFSNSAYGAFDKNGNYYCDPSNLELEKIIYKSAVNKLNYEVDSYLSLNPDSAYPQFRDYIIHASSGSTESIYDIMNKAQTCLALNRINPISIAQPINVVSKIGYAPEFGTLARLVVLISVIGVIMITRRFYMKS